MIELDDDGQAEPLDSARLELPGLLVRVEQTLLGGPRKYNRIEVSRAAGIDPEEARDLWRALGFAMVSDDEVVFTDGDVAALRHAKFLTDHAVIDDERRTAMTRMLGQTFSRLAAWQGQLLLELVTTRPDLLSSNEGIMQFLEELLPVMEETQTFVWRRQLASYLSRVVSHETTDIAGAALATTVVGFADMSGFTSLTRKATEAELRDVLEAFEAAATEVVGAYNGRIVKTIGDEVLFVADKPADGAEIGLDLHAAAAANERLPPLCVGLAAGPVVSRLGDVYGSTVNIASRLASICRPGWVLVDRVMAESLRDDPRYVLKPRRAESVRGFHHLRTWRLRRADERSRQRRA
jgi:adenylate cyclase